MAVTIEFLERYAQLKRQKDQMDEAIAAIKEDADIRIEQVKAEYGNLDTELEILRKRILAEHPGRKNEALDIGYDGLARVQVKWLPKVNITSPDKLCVWLDNNNRSHLYKREIKFEKKDINKIVEGLNMAGLELPAGISRETEATLYITLVDKE